MRRRIHYILIVLVFHCSILSCTLFGFEKEGFIFPTSPHCGIYCVYAAARYCGTEMDFVDLVKPEYIGSAKGSSLNELKNCVEDVGLNAKAIQNIDSRFLRQITWPVILHVKKNYVLKDYSHYVLFMGTENDKAIILDSSGKKLISFSDLHPLMDGIGLVVSSENIAAGKLIWSAKGPLILYTLLVFISVNVIRILFQKDRCRRVLDFLLRPVGSYIAQAGVVIAISFAAGFLFHFFGGGGYLSNTKYTEPIIYSRRVTFIPKIGKNKVKALQREGAVIIDARYSYDFKEGSIDGAISLPINADDDLNNIVLRSLDRDSKIIVYCQSAGCEFANITALRLKENNYDNISVYRGGWTDWIN